MFSFIQGTFFEHTAGPFLGIVDKAANEIRLTELGF